MPDQDQKHSSRKIVVEPNGEKATWFAAELVKTIICEAVDLRGVCRMALAGGTTPHGLYLMLAGVAASGEVPWQHVEVFFGDEHDVPQDHAESNFRMAQSTLLDHVPVKPQNIYPMPADAGDLEAASESYAQTIRNIVPAGKDEIPTFDLILLGMGHEGHTASLFPGTDALKENKKLVIAYFVPVLGRKRMTFTYPLLNAAKNIILLITGDDKAEAVAGLLGNDQAAKKDLPAANVNPKDGLLTIILDSAAARRQGVGNGERA